MFAVRGCTQCQRFHFEVHDTTLMTSVDEAMCKHWATKFAEINNMPYRDAIRSLMELGFSEDHSKFALDHMKSGNMSNKVN